MKPETLLPQSTTNWRPGYLTKVSQGFAAFIVIVASLFIQTASAQCTSGCTIERTISGSNNAAIVVHTSPATVCINGSGTYNGNINFQNRSNITICIGPNVTVSSSAQFGSPGSNITVNNQGTLNIGSISPMNGTWVFNNSGTMTTSLTVANSVTVNNSGTWNPGALSLTGGTITNAAGASITTGSFAGNSGSFTGDGNFTVSGSMSMNGGTYNWGGTTSLPGFTVASGPNITFGTSATIRGTLTINSGTTVRVKGQFNVQGNLSNQGNLNIPNDAGSCVAICPSGTFTNNSPGQLSAASGKAMTICKDPGGSKSGTITTVATPSASASSLNISQSGSNVLGTFTPPSPQPGGYLVLRKASAFDAADEPVFGGTYTVGSTIGGATVVQLLAGSATSFSEAIPGCNTYYYRVVSASNSAATCASYRNTSPAGNTVALQSVGGTVAGGTTLCSGDEAPQLNLAGETGSIVRWQSSTVPDFSSNVSNINVTTNSYTPSSPPVGTTYYRSVVQLGSCAVANSTASSITVVATPTVTNWTGNNGRQALECNNWDNGRPGNPSNVTINGNSNTPLLEADLTVNNLNFGATNPNNAAIDLNGHTLTVNGTLTLGSNSVLSFNNGKLVINGGITGTGLLAGGADADLELNGSTAVTLNFAAGSRVLRTFTNNKTANVTFGSDITVEGAFVHSAGTLLLGTNTTTLNGPITMSSGVSGNSSAKLIIGGSGAVTGNLNITSSLNLHTLRINRAGATFTMANNLTIGTDFTHTAGVLRLNGRTLALNGAINFDGGTFQGNGSVNIGGSGAISGSMVYATTLTSTNITMNRANRTLTLGSDLTLSGALTLTAGTVALGNGTLLTTSGSISYNGGSLQGNAGASITLSGSSGVSTIRLSNTMELNNLTVTGANRGALVDADLRIRGVLTVTNSTFTLNNATLTMDGNFAYTGTGAFTLQNSPSIVIQGTGTLPAAVTFAQPAVLSSLTNSRANSNLTLGSSLSIAGDYTASNNAILSIGANTLTLGGTSSGVFRGTTSSNVVVNGTGAGVTLNFDAGHRNLNGLTVNRGSDNHVMLTTPLAIAGNLTMQSGILTNNANTISLGTTGTLVGESSTAYVVGLVSATRTVASNVAETFGNLGVSINAAGSAPGSTTVIRNSVSAPTGNGNEGVRNSVTITPTVNTNLNATLTFRYVSNSHVLNGTTPSRLGFWRSTDGGTTWQRRNVTSRDLVAQTISLAGVQSFSDWALGDDAAPLPVTLTGFWGRVESSAVILNWRTASEQNNAGFRVEASQDQTNWQALGFVEGNGTTSSPRAYEWQGAAPAQGTYYRLVQVDRDGKQEIISPIFLQPKYEGDLNMSVFPNPTKGDVNISYHGLEAADARLTLMDPAGRVISSELVQLSAGTGRLPLSLESYTPGVYTAMVQVPGMDKNFRFRIVKQ